MSDFVTPILQWLNANPELAGFATFIISAAESVAIIGTIVPGSVMMSAVGALVGAGIIPFWSILIWAILGAIVGDGISYWIGYYFKGRLHQVWPFRTHPYLLESGERFFSKYGGMSVFIGRFVGPVRALVPLVAGMLGVKPLRFTIANVASAILWAPIYMLPGFILGAASTELPSELAGRIILILSLYALVFILCVWFVVRLFLLIRQEINASFTRIWNSLKESRYFRKITSILKHHDNTKTYGQLTLAIYFIITCLLFIYLASYIYYQGSADIYINNFTLHFFRSLRNPNLDHIMLYITFLGEKHLVVILILVACIWFFLKRYYYTALHTLLLGILTVVGVKFFKNLIHSPRPWGVLMNGADGYSFPSGHTTLAFTAYLAFTFFIIKIFRIKHRWPFYLSIALLISAIAISRLYFSVHWLTDIIGGLLLSSAILMIVIISYNRVEEKKINPHGLILSVFIAFIISYTAITYLTYDKLKKNYTLLPWPTTVISFDTWWQQKDKYFPLFRVNRFGLSVNAFNVQWLGNLDEIQTVLFKNHWETPPPRDWLSILYRLTDVQSTEHLPLMSPVYLDRKPDLVLIKYSENNKRLVVLRLWKSQYHLAHITLPLWLGSIEYAPATYSWLFKRKETHLILEDSLLFTNQSSNYDIKFFVTYVKADTSKTQKIILIKPKNLNQFRS